MDYDSSNIHFKHKYLRFESNGTVVRLSKNSIKSFNFNDKDRIMIRVSGGFVSLKLPIVVVEFSDYLELRDKIIAIRSSNKKETTNFIQFCKQMAESVRFSEIPANYIHDFNEFYKEQ